MREGSEKGALEGRDARRERGRGRREKDAWKEGRKRGDSDEVQKQENEGKKVGKKRLFELSLCAKQLPGLYPGEMRDERKRLSLCSLLLCVSSISRIDA